MTTYYDILGVSTNATEEQIRAAYRRKALATHPDTNPEDPLAPAKFKRVQTAYETLSDSGRRALYDSQSAVLAGAYGYWDILNKSVTFSYSYYGYDVPLDAMQQAEEEAERQAADSGMNRNEIMSRLLLEPLVSHSHFRPKNGKGDGHEYYVRDEA